MKRMNMSGELCRICKVNYADGLFISRHQMDEYSIIIKLQYWVMKISA